MATLSLGTPSQTSSNNALAAQARQQYLTASQWDKKAQQDPIRRAIIAGSTIGVTLSSASARLANDARAQRKRYDKWLRETIRDPQDKSAGIVGDITTGIDNAVGGILFGASEFANDLRQTLQPVSDFMGSTLGTLTGVIKDPFGPQGIGNVATNLLNKVSPGLGDKTNNSTLAVAARNLQNLPAQLFSGLDHLITAIDDILAIPFGLLNEIYFGYMEIMKKISEAISNLMNGFIELFFSILDPIIQIRQILDLLQAVGSLASQIGTIASTFFNINQITQFTNIVQNVQLQIQGLINDPTNLIISVLPPQINEAINLIQSPEQIINSFLPPELNNVFAKLPSIAGFGFNGNMGFGLQSVLQGVQGGVVRSIFTEFANQYDVLAPLLAGTGFNDEQAINNPATLNNGYNSAYTNERARRNNKQYRGP